MTSLLRLHTPVVDAFVAQMEARVPGIIDVLAGEQPDLGLEHPAAILPYVPTPVELNAFPAFCVQDGEGYLADDAGGAATGVYDVAIVVFALHADQRTLALQLRQYVVAAVNACYPPERGFGPVWGLNRLRLKPGPTLGRSESPREWMSYSGFTVTARVEEPQHAGGVPAGP